MSRPEIALVHDYLTQQGGAERVVLTLADAYPDAVIHTSLYAPDGTFPGFREPHRRDLARSTGSRCCATTTAWPSPCSPPPSATSMSTPTSTICSSSGWAHGAPVTGAKIVYCHNPARWLYQRDQYLDGSSRLAAGRPRAADTVPRAVGPAGRGHRRPLPGQLPRRAGTGWPPTTGSTPRWSTHPWTSTRPPGRRAPAGRGAGLRALRLPAAALQERRGRRRGVRPHAGPPTRRRGHRAPGRGARRARPRPT